MVRCSHAALCCVLLCLVSCSKPAPVRETTPPAGEAETAAPAGQTADAPPSPSAAPSPDTPAAPPPATHVTPAPPAPPVDAPLPPAPPRATLEKPPAPPQDAPQVAKEPPASPAPKKASPQPRDATPPVIAIEGVTDGGQYAPGISVILRIEDHDLDEDRTSITLNDAPYTSGEPIVADNSYMLIVKAYDRAGNRAARRVRFVVSGQ